MNCIRNLVRDKISFDIKINPKFRQQWKDLKWGELFKISMEETKTMTAYGIIPAIFGTINMCFGYDNLILLWMMSIVTAYIIQLKMKHKEIETFTELFSPVALVRYVTFFLIVVKCFWLTNYLKYSHPFDFEDFIEELPLRFVACHATVTANISLYRLYLTFFGVFKNATVNKFQIKEIQNDKVTETISQVPTTSTEPEVEKENADADDIIKDEKKSQ